jgi:hypothetical protein
LNALYVGSLVFVFLSCSQATHTARDSHCSDSAACTASHVAAACRRHGRCRAHRCTLCTRPQRHPRPQRHAVRCRAVALARDRLRGRRAGRTAAVLTAGWISPAAKSGASPPCVAGQVMAREHVRLHDKTEVGGGECCNEYRWKRSG